MSLRDTIPLAPEVVRQLAAILSSRSFKVAPTQSRLLSMLVERTLKGLEVDEDVIGYELFPSKFRPDDSSDIRVNAKSLRARLKEYYRGEGRRDLVVISLPEPSANKKIKLPSGLAYKPSFAYAPHMPAMLYYREGQHLLANEFPLTAQLEDAQSAFREALHKHPKHASSHAALAEIALLKTFCTYDIPAGELIAQADSAARTAAECDPELAAAHIMIGAIESCRWNWAGAHAAFKRAEHLDSQELLSSPWYAAFLLAIAIDGNFENDERHWEILSRYPAAEEPLRLMRLYGWEKSGNTMSEAIHQVFRYATRHGGEYAPPPVRKDWLTLGISNLGIISDGAMHFREVPDAIDGETNLPEDFLNGNRFIREICPGLAPICVGLIGYGNLAEEIVGELLARRRQTGYVRHFQIALGYIGIQKNEWAIRELELACEENDPYMAWLHLWPVLDPLREYPGFKSLVRRMNLPPGGVIS